ncbi:DUF3857 domain-containing protein [Phnomibacter sp. MR]|uniref:DUF3857 domain-containing protein n=1 Tax=Phnomibacter sp. MR TaxID=3042318 RepID=UPI003A7FCD10
MKYWSILTLAALLHTCAIAQQYAVALIPDSLRKAANVVKRTDVHEVTIESKLRGEYRYTVAYTILNAQGDDYATHYERYDKFQSINHIEAHLYDALGNKIKSLKKNEINDLSGMGAGTEISDDRIKSFGFYHKTYPFTVEFIVSVSMKGLMFLPNWYAIEGERLAVEQSSFEITTAPGISVLSKVFNYPGQPVQISNNGQQKIKWEVRQLPAIQHEYAAPPWHEISPAVFTAMKDFQMDQYHGSNESWARFGSFVYELIKGRDELPPLLKGKVQELIAGKTTTYEKVAALYQYMQQNTRYISIQLGIGGWQPFDAAFVYNKKYGDCKALTNYMHALLKEANIPSIYTLVKAGRGNTRFIEDFPSSQFNHVILCVPQSTDSIWLECTSQTMPAGYLGDFTNNRPVLLVKETDSKLVRTPHYNEGQNQQLRHVKARLSTDGQLSINASTMYTAMQQDDLHGVIHALTPDKQKEWLQQRFALGTYEIKNFTYSERMKALPELEENIDIEVSNYAQVTGKRLMFAPNIMSKGNWRLNQDSFRKADIVFTYPYTDIDTVTIDVGTGYKVEALPKAVHFTTAFGSYQSSCEYKDGAVLYYRRMQRKEGRFAASQWKELEQFYEQITKADRSRIVLVKAE